jgi:hypothetical protein
MNASQQLSRLQTIPVRSGDVVVFYDGVNDIYYRILMGARSFAPVPDESAAAGHAGAWRRRAYEAIAPWRDTSALLDILATRWGWSVPETVADRSVLNRNLSIARSEYLAALEAARGIAAAADAHFLHVFQPQLFATPVETSERRRIAADEVLSPPGVDVAFREGYPVLADAMREAAQRGVVSVDLSARLDARLLAEEVFLDFAHVNHVANEIVAREMFKAIGPALDCR